MKKQLTQKEIREIERDYARAHPDPTATDADLPDCSCGWSGKGTGPGGRFVKGDRCPECGESLA